MFKQLSRLLGSIVAGCVVSFGPSQAAEPVKFTLDWTYEGSHAPFALTHARGLFKKEGLDVRIDRGYGSGDTIAKVAAGAYDFGYADINVLVQYNKEHPDNPVTCVFLLYDTTMNTVIARKSTGIDKPADLVGKKLAAPVHDNSRLLFPLYAKAVGLDPQKVEWMTVQANVRDAMLVRAETDAIAAIETARLSIASLGLGDNQLSVFRFSKALPELLGRGVITSQKTLKERPDVVRAFIRGLVTGTKQSVQEPEAAVRALRSFDDLVKIPLELDRFKLNLEQSLLSDNVKANGLSSVTSERAALSTRLVAQAFGLPAPQDPRLYYDDRYLPAPADRAISGK